MADVVTVVDGGLNKITALLAGVSIICPGWAGWGVGITAAAVGNVGLETPSVEARTAGTKTQTTTTTANDTFQNVALITCVGAPKAITEVALFDALTGGSCFLRGTFSPINVSVGDTITFTIKTVIDQV